MTKKKTSSLRCPSCRKIVLAGDPELPFCSERCRVIDLGKWASGGYAIPAPLDDSESGGETGYDEPPERDVRGGRRGPEASSAERDAAADESETHARRRPN